MRFLEMMRLLCSAFFKIPDFFRDGCYRYSQEYNMAIYLKGNIAAAYSQGDIAAIYPQENNTAALKRRRKSIFCFSFVF